MRMTGIAALLFWIALGAPGALLYGSVALLVTASAGIAAWIIAAWIAAASVAPMPFVGAFCVASGVASDEEGF